MAHGGRGRVPERGRHALRADANGTRVLASRAREGLKQAYLQAHVSATLTMDEECARYADRLGAYARGGLRTRAERGLRKHLEECAKCRLAAGQIKEVACGIAGLLVAVIGWFGAAGYAKAVALIAGGAGAGAAGAAGAAAATSGGSGGAAGAAGAASGGAGAGGGAAASEGLGAPVKVGIAAGVVAVAAAAVALALVGNGSPAKKPEAEPTATSPVVEAPRPTPTPTPSRKPAPGAPVVASAPKPSPTPTPQPPQHPHPSRHPHPPRRRRSPRPHPPAPGPHSDAHPAAASAPVVYQWNELQYGVTGDHTKPEMRLGESSWVWQRWGVSIAGQRYTHGVTVHGKSSVTIDLNRNCSAYDALVGVDDLTLGLGQVSFSVDADGARLWQSPLIEGGEAAIPVHVNLTGRKTVRLAVELHAIRRRGPGGLGGVQVPVPVR